MTISEKTNINDLPTLAQKEPDIKKQNKNRLTSNSTDNNGANIFALLFIMFMGEEDNHNDIKTDDTATKKITDDLEIDYNFYSQIANNAKSGDVSPYEAATSVYSSINLKTANFGTANNTFKKFHNLSNAPPADDANFLSAAKIVLKLEGGWNPNEPGGGVANYGINSKANPDIDVANLTRNGALQLFKDRYWDKVKGIENLDQRTATIALDLAVNSGPARANQFLAKSGGDIEKLMEMRADYFAMLAEKNPTKYAGSKNGWDNRLTRLWAAVEQIPSSTQVAFNEGGVDQRTDPVLTPKFDGKGVDQIATATITEQNTPETTPHIHRTPA